MTAKQMPIFFLLLLPTLNNAQVAPTSGKTLSKSFNTEGKTTVSLDLPGTVELRTWANPSIRVEVTVSLPNGNASLLSELATVGRYNLSARVEGDVLRIAPPNMQKQIRVKGEVLRETLSFVVFVPKDMKVELPANTTTGSLANLKD
jgi:hypothetical protein